MQGFALHATTPSMKPRDNRPNAAAWYDANADKFFRQTKNLDLSHAYKAFLTLLPDKARILDAGCGSGRDTRHFLSLGHEVRAFDLSPEMVRKARAYTGAEVDCMGFTDLNYQDEFHGVFASASLLHLPPPELTASLEALSRALVDKGILYASFKHGDREWYKDDILYFRAYDESALQFHFSKTNGLRITEIWTTPDLRPGRKDEIWVHVLGQKNLCATNRNTF